MEKIETQLKRLSPELSMHESQVLWSRVEGSLSPRGAKDPKKAQGKRSLFRVVTAGFVILGLLGGSVITAYASEALPGDPLYPAKITIERAQIVLAPVEKKKDLQLAYADRRIKEVAAVLSDIEEESDDLSDPTQVAVSAQLPEVATMAFAVPSDEGSAGDALAMKAVQVPVAPVGDLEDEGEGRVMRSAALPVDESGSAEVVVPTSASFAQESLTSGSVKQQKRWKNLENKKKALAIAIKELERSRKDLQESGATTTSQNVDVVIMNLTELNDRGTTPDDMFVEKAKNSEIEVVDEEEKDARAEDDEKDKDDDEVVGSDDEDPATYREAQGAAVFLSGDTEVTDETEKEIQEVRVRNDERRKRNVGKSRGTNSEEKTITDKRMPVCVEVSGRKEELLVLEERLPWYIKKGFTAGKCVSETAAVATSTSLDEVSQTEEKGILDE